MEKEVLEKYLAEELGDKIIRLATQREFYEKHWDEVEKNLELHAKAAKLFTDKLIKHGFKKEDAIKIVTGNLKQMI